MYYFFGASLSEPSGSMKKLTGSIASDCDCTVGELTVEGLNVNGSDYRGLAKGFKDSGIGFDKTTLFA